MKKLVIAILYLTISCTDVQEKHGANIRATSLDSVSASSNKQDVLRALGSPSTTSTYGDETWYYISNDIKRNLTSSDDISDQSVLMISFDDTGFISNIELYDTADKRDFDTADRETPTAGHDLTVIEQLLGNLGRFNAAEGLSK